MHKNMHKYKLLFLLIFLLIKTDDAFPKGLLYKHHQSDSSLPNEDEVSSEEIILKTPIVFYGETYESIYVNSNGLLSFQTEIPIFFNIQFPLNYPVIAPLYTNVDIRQKGTIWYSESQDPDVLARGTRNVRDSFSRASEFQAKSVFIAIWENVGYHNGGTDKLNTFQVAVISDGEDSYVEFIYPEKGIEWIQGTGGEGGLPDARAQAGIVSPDGDMFTLPGSGTDKVRLLEKKTNMNAPGQWIFHVSENVVAEPDRYEHNQFEEEITSCAAGATQCHSQAKCNDNEEGFCCVCNPHFYGNGKSCIKNDVPLRANGKVSGSINGVRFQQLDLQSYIVMSDGRAYTAVSKVPREIGPSAQALQIIGGSIGFLFAKPISDVKNGYQLTGGIFNHSINLKFSTGQRARILQHYLGLDVFDQLKLEVDIQGNLPNVPDHEKLELSDFEEQYTVTSPGVILSTGVHRYTYGPNHEEISYNIDQTIEYTPCKFGKTLDLSTWKLKVSKNYISYETKEQILRFGMSDKVVPLADIDPCKEGRETCPQYSSCIVEGDSFSCVCNPGYQQIYNDQNQVICVDINECQVGLHNCDHNAQCINQPGRFICMCNPGFEGDGYYCTAIPKHETCETTGCPENAYCHENRCQCLQGYIGDGKVCEADKELPCDIDNNCSPFGICSFNEEISEYECKCQDGYIGNGYVCERSSENELESTEKPEKEKVHERCMLGACWCPNGYVHEPGTSFCLKKEEDDAYTTEHPTKEDENLGAEPLPICYNNQCSCTLKYLYDNERRRCLPDPRFSHDTMGFTGYQENLSCSIINNCHPHAQCVFVSQMNAYQCQCNAGYEGDGFSCEEAYTSCLEAEICDIEATCQYEETTKKHICICNSGFQGDGLFCEPIVQAQQCRTYEDCHETEICAYSSHNQRYECECKLGYERDRNGECIQTAETCGGGICVENAQCLFDPDHQTHYCECKPDFIGDGITECRPRPIGCNVINNCGLHASCLFDPSTNLYQCQCDHGYFGDGFICSTIKTCHADPYLCDFHASCIQNSDRQYICECNKGFTGNGSYCKPAPTHEGKFLLLNQGMATLRVPFEPTPKDMGKPIQIQYYQMAIGLDIDCMDGRVYWSDITGKAIKSSAYNGTAFQNFITEDIGSPEGLSIDWISRNIYWTDSSKDTLEVANIDTKLRKVLFSEQLVNPRGIAVHPQRGKVFWSDWDRQKPKIEWANMDGTGREIFLMGDKVHLPNSLAIDWLTDQLCYADAGTKKIECVNIDNRSVYTIAVNCTYPFGLAISDERFYWTDWVSQKIESVDRNTLHRQTPIKVPLGGSGNKLYGMVAVPEQCPRISNACQYGQCPTGHICLPTQLGRRTCVCIENCNNR